MSMPDPTPRVLAYTSPAWGHLSPIVPVLTELARRGWAVRVRTLASACSALRAAGLEAEPISVEIERIGHDDWKASSPVAAQKRAMAVFARRAPLDAADLQQSASAVRPDMLLVDVMALGALAAAEASGLPYATWLPYPAWIRREGAAPYGPGLAPMDGLLGRLRNAAVRRLVAGAAARFTEAANAGRSVVGLNPITSPDEILLLPPCVVAMTDPALEYPGPWPATFHQVGPLTWDPSTEAPSWLAGEQRPIVLVSTSSEYQHDDVLVQAAFDALADRHDLAVVATVPGGGSERVARLQVPSNGRAERFVPHSAVLPRCAVVVCHGGAGITHRALAAGVPVVAVPFGRDQLEVARRAEMTGAAVRLPVRRLTPQRLRRAIAEAQARREQARNLAARIELSNGPAAAADAIGQQLGWTAAHAR
jgi:MGT family glycosyltransferase